MQPCCTLNTLVNDEENDFDFYIETDHHRSRKAEPYVVNKSQFSPPKIKEEKALLLYSQSSAGNVVINPKKIVSFYAELCSGIKVRDFLVKYFEEGFTKQNIKYFVEFGLLNQLIYRLHKYAKIDSFADGSPADSTSNLMSPSVGVLPPTNNFISKFRQKNVGGSLDESSFGSGNFHSNTLNGSQTTHAMKMQKIEMMISEDNCCFDEMCVKMDMTPNELDSRLKYRSNIITYYK